MSSSSVTEEVSGGEGSKDKDIETLDEADDEDEEDAPEMEDESERQRGGHKSDRRRIKRPRHCVYCLNCLHLLDKRAVAEYCDKLKIRTMIDRNWKSRGKDHYFPIVEHGCEVWVTVLRSPLIIIQANANTLAHRYVLSSLSLKTRRDSATTTTLLALSKSSAPTSNLDL